MAVVSVPRRYVVVAVRVTPWSSESRTRRADHRASDYTAIRTGEAIVEFTVHDENSAPAEATALTQAKKQLGFIPNLYGVLAESPQACS